MKSRTHIKQELKNSPEEEFGYNGDIGSIEALAVGEYRIKVDHFVIRSDERRNGYGSRLFECLLDVIAEEGYHSIIVEIQSVSQDGREDPVMDFLRDYGFRYQESFDHHNWGDCIRATGYV